MSLEVAKLDARFRQNPGPQHHLGWETFPLLLTQLQNILGARANRRHSSSATNRTFEKHQQKPERMIRQLNVAKLDRCLGRLGKPFIHFFLIGEQLLDARALLHALEMRHDVREP